MARVNVVEDNIVSVLKTAFDFFLVSNTSNFNLKFCCPQPSVTSLLFIFAFCWRLFFNIAFRYNRLNIILDHYFFSQMIALLIQSSIMIPSCHSTKIRSVL